MGIILPNYDGIIILEDIRGITGITGMYITSIQENCQTGTLPKTKIAPKDDGFQ